jgi:hypothetical protein
VASLQTQSAGDGQILIKLSDVSEQTAHLIRAIPARRTQPQHLKPVHFECNIEKTGTNLACSDMWRGSKAEARMVQDWILDD